MNWYLVAAGLVNLMMVTGHFAVGGKEYLKPMLNSQFEPVPKKVMHCVFHYISAYLIFSALALLLAGFGVFRHEDTSLLLKFIAINYAAFATWQIALALMSGISNPLKKMFQWTLFIPIAVLTWLGS